MTAAQINPTPKARFQEKSGAIEAHHNLLESDHFDRAQDMALLEYQRKLSVNLGTSQNAQVEGMVMGWKLAGVQEFLAEFRGLAEKGITVQPPGIARVLDHAAQ